MLGIIGGSGVADLDFLHDRESIDTATPYGGASTQIVRGTFSEQVLAFLPRHGAGHSIPPHAINYRANIWSLKQFGVTEIIALNAVGAIRDDMAPGDLALPDQILDFTWGRAHTFFDGGDGVVEHVDFTVPYHAGLREALKHAAGQLDQVCHTPCVYAATQGPRLESSAEIIKLERDGADIVGMTGMPEAALARELGIPYASLCIVANMAAGKLSGELSLDEIFRNLELGAATALSVVKTLLQNRE